MNEGVIRYITLTLALVVLAGISACGGTPLAEPAIPFV
jgi:hypothetical protein